MRNVMINWHQQQIKQSDQAHSHKSNYSFFECFACFYFWKKVSPSLQETEAPLLTSSSIGNPPEK